MNDLEISPQEVKKRLDRGEKLLLVDVREPTNTFCARSKVLS